MNFGANLRELREKRNLTQSQVAEKVGVSTGAIAQYELAIKSPSITVAERIAEALGVSIMELLKNR